MTHVLGTESVELTDAKTDTLGYFMTRKKVVPESMEGKADTPMTEENKSSTHETAQEHSQSSIALRTVPVILKHRERRLKVNCFLEEGIDTSYVNEDVVEELGTRNWELGRRK